MLQLISPLQTVTSRVGKLIGSLRRELLDHILFWTVTDPENKLRDYQCYYNERRTHTSRNETTPVNLESGRGGRYK